MINPFYDKFIFTSALKYRHHNFFLMNVPFVIVPTEILAGVVSSDDVEFNKKLYYKVKEFVRKHLYKQFHLDFGISGEKAIEFVETFFSASGWGLLKNVDLDFKNKRAIVVVKDSPFAKRLHGRIHLEIDHFLRGVLAGAFSRIFGSDVECIENKCLCTDKSECEFVIKPQHELNFWEEHILKQINPKV